MNITKKIYNALKQIEDNSMPIPHDNTTKLDFEKFYLQVSGLMNILNNITDEDFNIK